MRLCVACALACAVAAFAVHARRRQDDASRRTSRPTPCSLGVVLDTSRGGPWCGTSGMGGGHGADIEAQIRDSERKIEELRRELREMKAEYARTKR